MTKSKIEKVEREMETLSFRTKLGNSICIICLTISAFLIFWSFGNHAPIPILLSLALMAAVTGFGIRYILEENDE